MTQATTPAPALQFSDDQAQAFDALTEQLRKAGVDLGEDLLHPPRGETGVSAVIGKAGSGKTLLLAEFYKALAAAGVEVVSGDYESRKKSEDKRTLAILAPTNKAASVLRLRGVPATTIHRILYTPVYDPEYERIADWLAGEGEQPEIEGLPEDALARAAAFYAKNKSMPGALAAAGLRGSDFITGWKRRDEPLDVGMIDEASMLDDKQFEDLKEIFPSLILFGDPAVAAGLAKAFTPKLITFFTIFLILGYVFYGAFFIAVGALAESMQDAQTLTTPIMLILTSCIMVVPLGMTSPDSPIIEFAAWFPLSAPFAAIVTLPSDPPWWKLSLSALFLFVLSIGVVWAASRVFQYGVLSGGGVKGVKSWIARVIFRRKSA